MKYESIKSICLWMLLGFAGCQPGDKMPPSIKTAQEAKTMLQGKTWMVKDVGLKPTSFGSQPAQDTPISIDWFSAAKELGEYETQAKESYAKASMTISMDTVITTVALEMLGPQTYLITDEPKENAQPGVRLEISGASEAFKEAGIVTFTYFVLGANDKMMLLQTPREINDRKVVLLLEGAAVH